MEFEVVFYDLPDGTEPVREFLNSTDEKMHAKLVRGLQLLALHGFTLRAPESKSLGQGIFELRVQSGSNISRVLYFFFIGRRIVLTNGFVKKTQKTPSSEIEKAIRYRAEYLQRERDNT